MTETSLGQINVNYPQEQPMNTVNIINTVNPINTVDTINTNKIIKEGEGEKLIYYLPAYLRLKVKNFTSISLQKLEAQANATIILTIYYKGLEDIKNQEDKPIVDDIKNNIVLHFNRDNAMKLTEEYNLETTVTLDQKKQEIKFVTRSLFNLSIESDVFWTPFQIIYFFLSVTVNPVKIKDGPTVKFNLMDVKNRFIKLSSTKNCTFGNYNLAEQLTRAVFTNERDYYLSDVKAPEDKLLKIYQDRFRDQQEKKQNQDQRIQCFEKAHFCVPLYKYPIVSLATIFIPLWLLAIINLAIFFQDQKLSDRIASIAAVMIASVALMPTIRSQIPPNPTIVFVQILAFFQTGTSLLTLIHSVNVRNIEKYSIIWYQSLLFWSSVIITLTTVIIIAVLVILHYFYWQPGYNQEIDSQKQFKFNRDQWKNDACDWYFGIKKQKHQLNYL